jgi:phosphatidylserine decarboxylase
VRIAPEGRPFIAGAVLLLAVFACIAALTAGRLWWLLPTLWVPIALWVPWFFRNPRRNGPRGEALISAPADGKVVAITEEDEPEYIGGPARRISIFMNVFNVHVNRHPVNGTVDYRHYRPGKFLNATLDKASSQNEQASLGIGTARGPVLVRQIAGLVARRIVTDASVGDPVRQGERLGLIRFGSRVDTVLPLEVEPRVSVGDRTTAGVTVIAEWP